MSEPSTVYPTLATALWPREVSLKGLRVPLLALIGVALLTLSAKVHIPFYPVPMTMQTFVVLAMGMAYGRVLGAGTVLAYLAVGALGLPVFSGTPERGIGLAYMTGTTGGYLLGFFFAAALCGWLAERGWDRSLLTTGLAMVAGNLLIYALGLLWLGQVVGWDKPVLAWGLYPFLLGDLAKILLAVAALPLAWKLLGRSRS
ncbi:MAG: biotin transporter BioY [Gammaproteobacteria bacterium]|nr:biotin transporter BioY [Gammaproteobacteria bacterium]